MDVSVHDRRILASTPACSFGRAQACEPRLALDANQINCRGDFRVFDPKGCSKAMNQVSVCIVGGGPVGMMLALSLNALGVASLLVNTSPGSEQLPRGNSHNARTMELYRRLGLARGLRRLGLPGNYPTDVVYLTRLNGWELTRVVMPSEDEKMAAVRNAATTDQIPEP